MFLATMGVAQETRIVDSLQAVLATQEGREKVKTMIELTWDFYDVSFDDCIDWGEKAIKEANALGFKDLEAKANYATGIQFAYHGDLDLAKEYLKLSYVLNEALADTANMFEAVWNMAYYEMMLGNTDTAYVEFQKVVSMAEKRNDFFSKAKAYDNIAVIKYKQRDFEGAFASLNSSRQLYETLNDSAALAQVDHNLATIYSECGRSQEARQRFLNLIPRLEVLNDYYHLMLAYKNYGQLFVKDNYNFDSASYYYEKAYSILDFLESNGINIETNSKVDLLVEMGNASYNKDDYKEAERWFVEALEMAETSSYASGKILACVGLGLVYSYISQPSKSLHYLNMIEELTTESGTYIAFSTIKIPLISNYARLGMFNEMGYELKNFKEQYDALAREIADLYDRNRELEETVENLAVRLEQQDLADEAQQTQLKRYRLAFFGLLSIALFAIALLVAREIVRKNRGKSTQS